MWINGLFIVDHLALIKTEKSSEECQKLQQDFLVFYKELKKRHDIKINVNGKTI